MWQNIGLRLNSTHNDTALKDMLQAAGSYSRAATSEGSMISAIVLTTVLHRASRKWRMQLSGNQSSCSSAAGSMWPRSSPMSCTMSKNACRPTPCASFHSGNPKSAHTQRLLGLCRFLVAEAAPSLRRIGFDTRGVHVGCVTRVLQHAQTAIPICRDNTFPLEALLWWWCTNKRGCDQRGIVEFVARV